MIFEIQAERSATDKKTFFYDNVTNTIKDDVGNVFEYPKEQQKKYTKKEAAYNAKLTKRRNNLIEKLKALDLEAQEGLRKLQKEFQDSADALVTLHKQN